MDKLDAILNACVLRTQVPDSDRVDVTVRSDLPFDVQKRSGLERLVAYAKTALDVELEIVGGGYGCAYFNFKIPRAEHYARLRKLTRLLKSRELWDIARAEGFDSIATPDPVAYVDLRRNEVHGLQKRRGTRVFCSYSHNDRDLQAALKVHFAPLEYAGLVAFWHDDQVVPGDDFDLEISKHLQESEIILLLVSAYFFASTYIKEREIPVALQRAREKAAHVVPIILRPVLWHVTPLAKLKALPLDGKAVTEWHDLHAAMDNIAAGVYTLLSRAGSQSG